MGRKSQQKVADIVPGSATKFDATQAATSEAARTDFIGCEVFESIAQQYRLLDEHGQPKVDPKTGEFILQDKFYAFLDVIINDYIEMVGEEVDRRLEEDEYASEAARQRDKDLLVALSIVDRDVNPNDEILTKEELAAMQRDGQREFQLQAEALTTQQLDGILDRLRKAGNLSDTWPLDTAPPVNNRRAFTKALGKALSQVIDRDVEFSAKVVELEEHFLWYPSAEAIQARLGAYGEFLQGRDLTGETLLFQVVTGLIRDGWSS
jgi:hypothetical protein